jgi:SAM-dependent methyltransferase
MSHLGGCIIEGDEFTYMPDIWQELLDTFPIRTILDVGCGAGRNLEWFKEKGLQVQGVEGWPEAIEQCKVPVIAHDYTLGPLALKNNYDLCICTEFVEHVEQRFEENWFQTMKSATHILMCHGLPGQAGYHHVNCQPSEYWVSRFAENGYIKNEELSEKFRDTGRDAPWGRNTLMFFTKQ